MLLPVTVLVRRAFAAEVIGAALLARAGGAGHRAIGTTRGLPATTVRGWLRVMGGRLEPVRRHLLQVAVRAGVDVRVPEALGCPWPRTETVMSRPSTCTIRACARASGS